MTKAQYFERLDEHHALDANRALARSWQVLEYYWQQLLLQRNQIYIVSLAQPLNEAQERALVERLASLGWHASVRRTRVTRAQCSVDNERCRCNCSAIDGLDLGANYLAVPDECLRLGADDANLYTSMYCGVRRVLYTEPSLRRWNTTAYAGLAEPKEDFDWVVHDEREYLPVPDLSDPTSRGRGWRRSLHGRSGEGLLRKQYRTACEQLTAHDLAPVQLLYLDTFQDSE
jgi:hypothetical protein